MIIIVVGECFGQRPIKLWWIWKDMTWNAETPLSFTEQDKNKSSSIEAVHLKTELLHQSQNCMHKLDLLSLINVPESGLQWKTVGIWKHCSTYAPGILPGASEYLNTLHWWCKCTNTMETTLCPCLYHCLQTMLSINTCSTAQLVSLYYFLFFFSFLKASFWVRIIVRMCVCWESFC